MKLIISTSELENEFSRLLSQYSKYYWTVAWAGIDFSIYNDLITNSHKLKKVIIGLHFYQTHAMFIETFINHKGVRYQMQAQGTYHPKLYLFFNSKNDWELVVGSSNFTRGGFNVNTEANVLISSSDNNASNLLKNAHAIINESWNASDQFSNSQFKNYKILWKNFQPKIKALSGFQSTTSSNTRPLHDVNIISLSWTKFYNRVRTDSFLEDRLSSLKTFEFLFKSVSHFKDLDIEDRKLIAGIPNKSINGVTFDFGVFGSMKGAGIFKNKIITNDPNISIALDQIPLTGPVTKKNYNEFIKYYAQTFPGNYIATATRLLAMKRPDIFYCLTKKNQKEFCQDFGISPSIINYQSYWDTVIEVIKASEWYLNPKTNSELSKFISSKRAAFLDALYYEY